MITNVDLNIWKDKYGQNTEKTRIGCRGIIIEDGKILLSYEARNDWYFIPGGGLEEGETEEEGCIREVAEESGYLTETDSLLGTIDGFWHEWNFRNHFFLCHIVGKTQQKLTNEEADNHLVPRWVPLPQAIQIFSEYEKYEKENEGLCESYIRDYLVLTELLKKGM